MSSCFAVLQRLGSGWVQSSPSPLPGERSQIFCGCSELGQFAALQDQPDRKAQRGLGFVSSEDAIALVSPCKLRGGPGSSRGCRLVWKEAFTSVLPGGLVTGRTTPVGPLKHHQLSLPRASAPLCPWPVFEWQRAMPPPRVSHWRAGNLHPFFIIFVLPSLRQVGVYGLPG